MYQSQFPELHVVIDSTKEGWTLFFPVFVSFLNCKPQSFHAFCLFVFLHLSWHFLLIPSCFHITFQPWCSAERHFQPLRLFFFFFQTGLNGRPFPRSICLWLQIITLKPSGAEECAMLCRLHGCGAVRGGQEGRGGQGWGGEGVWLNC